MQPNFQSKLITIIIAVVVLALIIVGLVWLSDNGIKFGNEPANTDGTLTDAQVNEILKNLEASADPNAKPLTDKQVDETLANLKASADPEAKPLTDAQVNEILKNLENSN